MSGQIGSRDADRTPVTGGWIPLVGTAPSGFVCSETQHTVTSVFQLQARPRSSGSGCLRSGLVGSDYICLLMVGRCLQKTREEKVEKVVIVGPLWRSQAWYPPREHQQSLAFFPSRGIC